MAGKECEAFGVLFEEHLAKVAVAETNLAAVSNRTGDAESLQADTDGGCSICGTAAVLLDGDGCADSICPLGIFKADGLNAFDQVIHIQAGCFSDFLAFFNGRDPIFLQHSKNLRLSSFV